MSKFNSLRIEGLLTFVYTANILDAILTLTWVKLQVADEANPIMAALLDINPWLFVLVKIGAVSASCVILWSLRGHKLSKWISLGAALLYAGIISWHIVGSYQAHILEVPTISELKEAGLIAVRFVADGCSQIIDQIRIILEKLPFLD